MKAVSLVPTKTPHSSIRACIKVLLCDRNFSAIGSLLSQELTTSSYSAYGNSNEIPISLIGFNGELKSRPENNYILGNGRRTFSPSAMRFNSPDSLSPFGEGGINSYMYCSGDPVNSRDPSGSTQLTTTLNVLRAVHRFKKGTQAKKSVDSEWQPLENKMISNLPNEVHEASKLRNRGKFRLTVIEDISNLSKVKDESLRHKFIVTHNQKLIMGSSKSVVDEVSHASVAELGKEITGSDKVISAGYIFKANETFYINNYSGHFRPAFERLSAASKLLQALGIEVELVRAM